MYAYDTVVEAVKGLKLRGFDIDFNLEADHIFCPEPTLSLKPAEFEITEFYRFEVTAIRPMRRSCMPSSLPAEKRGYL